MKTYKSILLASALTLGLASCGDFGDLNVNPESINNENVPYEMLFSNAQHQALGSDYDQWRTGCIYSSQFVQQMTSINTWEAYGRYLWSEDYSSSYWTTFSGDRGAMRDVTTCYDHWQNQEGMGVDWNIARVMRVLAFSKMTDLYGDIPYSQAGRPEKYSYPVYDTQQDIYNSMLKELDEAQANLSGTAKMGTQDLYYQGDAAKWKKLANSLMLRLAMRLVKVDPTTAKTWAAKAVANGVMTSNDDNAKLEHSADAQTTNDSCEPFAKILAHEDREFFLSDIFVDMLKNTNDPRLSLIATIAPAVAGDNQTTDIQKNSSGTWTAADYGNMEFNAQRGLLHGGYSDNATSQYFIGKVAGTDKTSFWYNFNDEEWRKNYAQYFSSANRCTYADPTAPTFIVTYAQTEFLLAEAVVRGYISGDAETHYKNGVKAAFTQFSQFRNGASAIAVAVKDNGGSLEAAAEKYLTENPYDASKALEQINTQYYINSFGDEYEVFSNWRRSGYPVLVANSQAALDGQCATNNGSIPRRFRYPTSESQVNSVNYNEAVKRLNGGDRMDSRVWWDAE